MKVYNLTDVSTDVLVQRGLVQQSIATSGRMVAPGEYIEVEDTAKSRSDLAYLLQVGAVSIDQPPPPYVLARQIAQANDGQSRRPSQHVAIAETQIAGEPPPAAPAEGETVTLEKNDLTAQEPEPPARPEDPPPMQPPPENEPKPKKR